MWVDRPKVVGVGGATRRMEYVDMIDCEDDAVDEGADGRAGRVGLRAGRGGGGDLAPECCGLMSKGLEVLLSRVRGDFRGT